jgi:glycosyltransferase involved in cell wall biosynthesis
MSQGLIPITFDVGVAPEIIRDGENGFLISTVEQAIERARELLANNDKRLAMAEAAKQTAEQFRSSRIADDLQKLYRSIKEERREKNSIPTKK